MVQPSSGADAQGDLTQTALTDWGVVLPSKFVLHWKRQAAAAARDSLDRLEESTSQHLSADKSALQRWLRLVLRGSSSHGRLLTWETNTGSMPLNRSPQFGANAVTVRLTQEQVC